MLLFRDDAYLKSCEANIIAINERGGVITDRTVFYGTSGGQPGDSGRILRGDGSVIRVVTTVTGETKDHIIHVPDASQPVPQVG
jgi:misacylated tRNA(Ala) deacylase